MTTAKIYTRQINILLAKRSSYYYNWSSIILDGIYYIPIFSISFSVVRWESDFRSRSENTDMQIPHKVRTKGAYNLKLLQTQRDDSKRKVPPGTVRTENNPHNKSRCHNILSKIKWGDATNSNYKVETGTEDSQENFTLLDSKPQISF